MSDYHGLETSAKFDTIRIAIHSNTPNGVNLVGYAYSQALLEHLGGSQVSQVPWLAATNPTENGLIEAGEILETIEIVEYDANSTQQEKVAAMNAYVAERIPKIEADLAKRLEYWGSDRTLPPT